MKKTLFAVLLASLAVLLCSCGEHTVVSVDGIDNCDLKLDSDFELGWYIIPEGFLEKFEYTDADYHFRVKTRYLPLFNERESMVLEIMYDPDIYIQAKEYCLQEMELSDTVIIEYNGYTFMDNVEIAEKFDHYGYPRWFNMLVYNDDLNRLIFIGFYGADYFKDDLEKVTENWGQFLETNFSDLYDFGSVESNDLTNG